MQLLQRPAVSDECLREPVEQFRVRRLDPLSTKVVGRGDEPAPEMLLPDSIHEHARV